MLTASEFPNENKELKEKDLPAIVEKFVIRLPNGLREQLKLLSEQNRRSMNAEIILVLEKHIHQSLMNQLHVNDMPESEDGEGEQYRFTDKQLSEKLEALPPGKKEALLELLG
ncbi:MAG: Arc family DNA-binding protein [Pseudomonadales bacterium]|nr:Arc family DNA-binding protein [Pseudomonadales bacterium]